VLCGLAGEAVNPKRNLPLAIMFTLVFVTVIYMAASLVLTGMQPSEDISPVSGFPAAFYANNANLAGHITALGEVVTLPLCVLITIMAQPRLLYAMAEDGLLPAFFSTIDPHGNLWNGTFTSGALMIFIATFVQFENLNDVISCAVLIILSLTDSSLVLLWHEPADPESNLAHHLVFAFHMVALTGAFLMTRCTDSVMGEFAVTVAIALMVGFPFLLQKWCPRTTVFGGSRHHYHGEQLLRDDGYFRTPLVPFLPCFGIFINSYLIAQLDLFGIAGLFACLLASSLYYFFCAAQHSVGNATGWQEEESTSGSGYDGVYQSMSDEGTRLTRSYSLPKINHS
jgi:amino acid transporter